MAGELGSAWPSALPQPKVLIGAAVGVVVIGLIVWVIVATRPAPSANQSAAPAGQTTETGFKLRHTKVGLVSMVPVTASVAAPAGWGATKAETPSGACVEPSGQEYLRCAEYTLSAPNGTAIHPGSSGKITIYDVSDWLNTSQLSQPAAGIAFANKTTPSTKQAAFVAAQSLNSGARITPEMIKSLLLNPVLGQRPPLAGISSGSYLLTANGQLRGYSYIATISSEREYRPYVVGVLAGRIAESAVVVEAVFELADTQMAQLATLPSDSADRNVFFAGYRDGFEYGPDVAAAQSTVANILKSVVIQP